MVNSRAPIAINQICGSCSGNFSIQYMVVVLGQVKVVEIPDKLSSIILNTPYISDSRIIIKIDLNFYFHTSLWCLKRFYECLYGLHKTF